MFRLFKSIFGTARPEPGRYDESVVREGMDLALAATDARMRTLPRYETKLRPAVLKTFDHVVQLVDALDPPLDLTREGYASDPNTAAFFVSPQHIQEVMREDPVLMGFLDGPEGRGLGEVHALLLVHRTERKVLGMELQGEIVRRDVAQMVINFGDHRLLGPAGSIDDSRRRLYRRAYNHVLQLALDRILADRGERTDLKHQRMLLEQKLRALREGQCGLDCAEEKPVAAAEVERRIEQLDQRLLSLGADSEVLNKNLDKLCEVLATPEQQIWLEPLELVIDRMGIKQTGPGANHLVLHLQELQGARGGTAVAQRVRIPYTEFPERPDFLTEASRYLL